jgi:hypothetical protein
VQKVLKLALGAVWRSIFGFSAQTAQRVQIGVKIKIEPSIFGGKNPNCKISFTPICAVCTLCAESAILGVKKVRTSDRFMRKLKRRKHLKIGAGFIARLTRILEDFGGEVSLRTVRSTHRIKAKVIREAACRYPNIFQLNLIRGRIPNSVRLMTSVENTGPR